MGLLAVSIILSLIACAVIFGCVYAYRKNAKYNTSKNLYYLTPFGMLGMLLLLTGIFTRVGANQVGIVYDELNGGIQDETYGEGLHIKSIFETITEISTANRSASIVTTGQTNDGQFATFELSIIYKINKEDAGKFYRVTNGKDIPSEAMNTIVKACLQSSTIKYDIFALLSTELEAARLDFMQDLSLKLKESYYITLVNVSFDEIDVVIMLKRFYNKKRKHYKKLK